MEIRFYARNLCHFLGQLIVIILLLSYNLHETLKTLNLVPINQRIFEINHNCSMSGKLYQSTELAQSVYSYELGIEYWANAL